MESDDDTLPLRPYQALIWGPERESIGVHAVDFPPNGDDAKRQAIQEHGEHCIFSIWNEEDSQQAPLEMNCRTRRGWQRRISPLVRFAL